MKPLPWSHTALADFVNCPYAFYEKRVTKRAKETEKSSQMIWGETVHKAFEDRMKDGTPLPPDLATHERYMRQLEALPGIGATEEKIALDLRGEPCGFFDRAVWFRGVIDYRRMTQDHALLVDYKTGKVKNDYQQLKLFALYIFIAYPGIQKIDVRYYWTVTEQALGERYTREQIPALWAEFLPKLRQYRQAFVEDIWQTRPGGLCNGWCPVTWCEHWKPKRNK